MANQVPVEIEMARILAEVSLMPQELQDRFVESVHRSERDEITAARAALMFVSQQAPGVKGLDRAFQQKARARMENMNPKMRQQIVDIAHKAGISTAGKYYQGGLGKYNDPSAWVSGADDVLAVAKAKGLKVSGAINYEPSEQREVPLVGMAPDIIDGFVGKYTSNNPTLAEKVVKSPKAMTELRERIIDKHGSKRSVAAAKEQRKELKAKATKVTA